MSKEKYKGISLISGGLDSTVLAYKLHSMGYDLHLLSFFYGQRHRLELERARDTASKLRAEHTVVDISSIQDLLKGSALTDNVDVPHGHYAAENMKATVVPNRNAIMLSIAFGLAASEKAQFVATAVHSGDHTIYPDCRPSFVEAYNRMIQASLASDVYGVEPPGLFTPFLVRTKADIVVFGNALGVPWGDTYSCYEGGEIHCGACGTCFERREAFQLAGVPDPTTYKATPHFTLGEKHEGGSS